MLIALRKWYQFTMHEWSHCSALTLIKHYPIGIFTKSSLLFTMPLMVSNFSYSRNYTTKFRNVFFQDIDMGRYIYFNSASATLNCSIILILKLPAEHSTCSFASKLQYNSVSREWLFIFGNSQKPFGTRGKWDELLQLGLGWDMRCNFIEMGLRSFHDL